MKSTGIIVREITLEEMLQRLEKEYNPTEFEKKVRRYASFEKIKFYVAEPDQSYGYARFFVSYLTPEEGLLVFSSFSPFSSTLTNNGFCKILLSDSGEVMQFMFQDSAGNVGRAVNDKKSRAKFIRELTPRGIMVSTSF